jgi:hypothetical protein
VQPETGILILTINVCGNPKVSSPPLLTIKASLREWEREKNILKFDQKLNLKIPI